MNKGVLWALILLFFWQQPVNTGWSDYGSLYLRPLATKEKPSREKGRGKTGKKKSLWDISAGSSHGLPQSTEVLKKELTDRAYRSWREGSNGVHSAYEENMGELAEFIGWYTDKAKGPIDKPVNVEALYSRFMEHGGSFRRSVLRKVEGKYIIEDVFVTTLCDVFGHTYMFPENGTSRDEVTINRIVRYFFEGYIIRDPERLNKPQAIEALYKRFKQTFWCPEFSESAFSKLLATIFPPDYLLYTGTSTPKMGTITLSQSRIGGSLTAMLIEAIDTEKTEAKGREDLSREEIVRRSGRVLVVEEIMSGYGPYISNSKSKRRKLVAALLDITPDMTDPQIKGLTLTVRKYLKVPEKAQPEGKDLRKIAALIVEEAIERLGTSPSGPVAEPQAAGIEPPDPNLLTAI